MKKVLFLGFNQRYISPYTETILNVLGSIMKISFYGPGYSNKEDLDLGIEKWIDQQEEFDFIMIDREVALFSQVDMNYDETKSFSNSIISFNREGNVLKPASELYHFFMDCSYNKIIWANFDPYIINQITIDVFTKSKAYILDLGGYQLFDSLETINKRYNLIKFKTHSSFPNPNDNWFNFLKQYKERIIVCPHTIDSYEFDYTPLSLRKNKFTVIGAGYPERKLASTILPYKTKLYIFKDKVKALFFIKLKRKMTIKKMALYRSTYFKKITDSQLTFCSGGPLLYPLRKYFEIPARGSVPIGWKCSGFDDLGFKDGVNFIIAENKTELKDSLKKYSLTQLQKIADEGRNLIWEKHSDWARREQLKGTFDLIFNGKFKGSYWRKGEYKNH